MIPIVMFALFFAPAACGAEPFRTTTKSYTGIQECTTAMWDMLQLLGGDKAVVKWDEAAPQMGMMELVAEAGKRILIRAHCDEVRSGVTSRYRFRGFIEFP